MSGRVVNPNPFHEHYAASQFRVEAWNQLKNLTAALISAEEPADRGEAHDAIGECLELLQRIELYWAFPGKRVCAELQRLYKRGWDRALTGLTARVVRLLVGQSYRKRDLRDLFGRESNEEDYLSETVEPADGGGSNTRHYFEVLVVDDLDEAEEAELRANLLEMRSPEDEFHYEIVVVPSFEDAVIAAMFNHNLQSCVLRYRFPVGSRVAMEELRHYVGMVPAEVRERAKRDPCGALAAALSALRPELDLFKVTDDTFGSVAASDTRSFRRVFYRQEDYGELHLSILKGVQERYETPFFSALRDYSLRPTGVFHALPISRGKSISRSHWIQDMGRFYGRNIFMAETSSTTGGLDSLLQPTGPLKKAQENFARAFGSRHSFFVTNGTSTANKIVTQALIRPGDLVLLSHDCHKSHPYALVLVGAQPVYLDAYPLDRYSMFGGVPLREIKRQLLRLKRAGKLDRARMLLLTNCTFDGIIYDPERVMREVLAIKPDMVFLWDEAWFAFACAMPAYRRRTAMASARKLKQEFESDEYRERYAKWKQKRAKLDLDDDAAWLDAELLPDPDLARVRVYATHSTHKTLTSLRQGSAIHVYDQDFEQKAKIPFHEAYMTHTSTSPNYQILASLDVGRRQVELEGYELVRSMVGLAMMIRRQVVIHPLLSKYFKLLRASDMIPEEHRPSGLERFFDAKTGFNRMEEHFRRDEFALDPTRITLNISATGMDGDAFRKMLMESYDIQINKTSRTTILLMVNIGSTRGSATYLLDVLVRIAEELEERAAERDDVDTVAAEQRVHELAEEFPPLPHFTRFHSAFADDPSGADCHEGDMRGAFFLSYDDANCEFLPFGSAAEAMAVGHEVVSAAFVTPYPPGFPILVPGQTLSSGILDYLAAVDVKEIHGFNAERGLRVFRQETLDQFAAARVTASASLQENAR